MRRANRRLAAAAIVLAAGICPAQAQIARPVDVQAARLTGATISGSVADERGGPLAGAMVSAFGRTLSMTVSDTRGRFAFHGLPTGDYFVQAHLSGFTGSRRQFVRVSTGGTHVEHSLQLRRLDLPVATTGAVPARPILAAGAVLPTGTLSDQPDAANTEHSHTETAWRLRHIRRSILKDSASLVTLVERDEEITPAPVFGRSTGPVGLATTVFNELPFSGEVNLLTTSVFGPGQLFSGDLLPRGVAYLAIGAPTPAGNWSVRAAMSQGDLSSWLVAGAFQSRTRGAHGYEFGLSYSTQEYLGGNLAALAAVTDGSRNAGEVYAFDRWTVSPQVSIEYGGRYARYDYLPSQALFSPMIGLAVRPLKKTRLVATIGQQMVAPGAEEFLARETPGPWLPPERTFAPLGGSLTDINDFRVERARYLDIMVEHEFDDAYVLGVRRFYQNVDDQLVTLFGLNLPGGPRSVGHYYVGSAGSLDAEGWAVRLSSPPGRRLRGSIDYSITRAHWLTRGDMAEIGVWAPTAIRPEREDLHDVTTSFEGEIPETATRIFVLYKINTGFTAATSDIVRPTLDARFDVQVNQALPFGLLGTQWEVLVGIRNLFRDPTNINSVYDELLVMRPPKRVVGGFLVRF